MRSLRDRDTIRRDRVAQYYDRNTRRFLRQGRRESGALHRELWGPAVADRRSAQAYADRIVLEEIARHTPSDPGAILDLGCGVGASVITIAMGTLAIVTGVTVSSAQVTAARRRAARSTVAERCRVLQADYLQLERRFPLRSFDAAYAIESFVHAADRGRFFESVAAVLQPGGLLIILDDFVGNAFTDVPTGSRERRLAARWLARFQCGWRAPNLTTAERAAVSAHEHGLDLLDSMGLGELHALARGATRQFMRLAAAVPLPGAVWGSVRGGAAVQECLRHGWIEHRRLTFRKVADTAGGRAP